MDPNKICTIAEWPTLKTVSNVLFFLGLMNFYYKFIKKYSKVVISLPNPTKKNIK